MNPTDQTPTPLRIVPDEGIFCEPCDAKMTEEESHSGECSRFRCPVCGNSTPWEELPQ